MIAKPFTRFPLIDLASCGDGIARSVTEKLDGTLIILYWDQDKPYLCTRGAFDSFQALLANKIFKEKYAATVTQLNKGCTYLFELVSPQAPSVLDYGSKEDLFLIGIVDNESWQEIDVHSIDLPFSKPLSFGDLKIEDLAQLPSKNKEGLVFTVDGRKLKYKYPEYKSSFVKHRECKKVIYEGLVAGKKYADLITHLPQGPFYKKLYQKGTDLHSYLYYTLSFTSQIQDKDLFNYLFPVFSHRVAIKLTKIILSNRKEQQKDDILKLAFRDLFFTSQYYSATNTHDIDFFR